MKNFSGGAVGKALVAANGRGARAQRAVGLAQHLAVRGADRHELVQRQHDACLGQRAARQSDQVDAQQQKMVEMHHIGVNQLQEFRVGLQQKNVRCLVPPVVVLAAQEQELAVAAVEPGDPRAALVQRGLRFIDRGEQGHVDLVSLLQALEQLITDLLRTAADDLGVKQADQQDPHADTVCRRVPAR